MIAMAKGLKKQIIAEGVETREQMAFLQAQGCDQAQGYYFSRPLVAQEFAKLLETGLAPRAPSPASPFQENPATPFPLEAD